MKQKATEIAPKSWCISEFNLVNAFLVEGDERSAIIDTGCGYGNIRALAEEYTSKPLVVLLTHKHPDHAGGIYHFADCKIYMNDADKSLTLPGMKTDNSFRRMYVATRGPVRCPGMEEEILKLIPKTEPDCSFASINIDDGDVIDLGGRRLECIHAPGHSEGSVCFLDGSARILFSGDTVNNSIILTRQKNNGTALIEKYSRSLEKLWKREAEFDSLAIGHDGSLIDKGIIHDYLVLTRGLLDGSIKGSYEETGFRKGDVARHGKAELWYQCDQ